MEHIVKSKLNKRAMVFFFMLISFLILPFSGIALHNADLTNYKNAKYISMAWHNVAAIVFLVSSAFHIFINRKPILNYLKNKKENFLKHPKELAIAGTTVAVLLLFALFHVIHSHI